MKIKFQADNDFDARILVSHDLQTMPHHFGQFISSRSSPGVIIVSQSLSVKEAVDWLLLIWEASEAEEYVNSIHRIPWTSA